jgi:cytochrome c-type protein NapC
MSKENPGAIRRFWRFLRTPSARWSLLTLLVVGFIGGLAFWGVFSWTLAETNTLEFCSTNCHEMNTVFNEYKQTIHYSNRSGVRAGCPDCHVPHALGPKLYAKIRASKEIWGKMTGVIDTPEKFEAHRMELATNQWAIMSSTGSRECLGCHNFDAMSGEKQTQSNYKRHMQAKSDGKICIDCHKGVAHHLPKEYHDPDEE